MNKLLYCPTCLSLGIKSILGEVRSQGIEIKRHHQLTTIIQSDNYQIVCGRCGDVTLVRRESHEHKVNKPKQNSQQRGR